MIRSMVQGEACFCILVSSAVKRMLPAGRVAETQKSRTGQSTVGRGVLEGAPHFPPAPASRWGPCHLFTVGVFPQGFIEHLLCARCWFRPWGPRWGRNHNLGRQEYWAQARRGPEHLACCGSLNPHSPAVVVSGGPQRVFLQTCKLRPGGRRGRGGNTGVQLKA